MILLSMISLSGCADKTPVETGVPTDDTADTAPDTTTPDTETACAEASALLGYSACVNRVPDEDTFTEVTIASTAVDQLRVGKYLAPANDDARIPTSFIDVDAFSLHYDFLITAFPDLFSGLSTAEYEQLTISPATREFYAGTLSLYIDGSSFFYGFTVWDDPEDSSTVPTLEDVTIAWQQLQDRFDIGDVAFVPSSEDQINEAATWSDAPFTVKGLADIEYEAYNTGEAYGTLRLYTLEELAAATKEAAFGYQDIVVISEAPSDLERVVSGIVTGTRQGDLSHLNVRSLARGTPNCYLSDPHGSLTAYADTMVRFECGESDYSVAPATQKEAEAWWDSIRPDPVEICTPDLETTAFVGLLDANTETIEDRTALRCTYGAKGANLATLYQRIDADYQFPGFLIPSAWYDQFMKSTSWTVDLGEGEGEYTFAETITAWHADDTFLTDAAVRRARLEDIRAAIEEAPMDEDFVAAIGDDILKVWGDEAAMVRFRSSSNAEDGLDFSGAGLYRSKTICLADTLDDDDVGPSICDPDKDNEDTIQEGLGKVWASVWNMQAWDERDWYGIDHSLAVMGILVNSRSKDELANAVAFTGNPTSDGDDRYLINAQEGELEVVSAEPGVFPERILVTLESGSVTLIDRISESSETPEVLTDTEIEALSDVLTQCSERYPNDYEVPEGGELLWDTEWKITSEGQLVIKQIRPYLR
ncbi:MAG: pyruvate,water dikinase [Myxococcota bacterium]|jgi:pyruvate,water dikinase